MSQIIEGRDVTTIAKVANRAGISIGNERRFGFLWSSLFVSGMAWGFTIPLISVVIVEAGIPIRTYGLLQSYAALASMLAQVWIGRASDRMGRRKPLVISSLLIIAPVVALFPRAEVALSFGALIALHSIAQNSFRAMNSAWVSGWAAPGSFGRMHGTFRIAGSLGWIVATPLLGVLMNRTGSASPFTLAAIIYIGIAGFIALAIPEDRLLDGEATDEARAPREVQQETDPEEAKASSVRILIQNPILLTFFAALGIFHLSQGMGMNLNSIYLTQDLQVSNTQFGWLLSFQAWLEVPLMLMLGAMSDRFNPRRVLGIGFGISGLRWLLLSWVVNPAWLYPVQSLHAVGVTVTEVLAVAFIARNVDRKFLGTAMGSMVAVQNATNLLSPALGGAIAHHHSIGTTFQLSGVLAVVASAVMLVSLRRRPQGKLL